MKFLNVVWKYIWKDIQLDELNAAKRALLDEGQLTCAERERAQRRSRILIRERTHKFVIEKTPARGTSIHYLLELSTCGIDNGANEVRQHVGSLLQSFTVRKEIINNAVRFEIESKQKFDEIEEMMF